MAHKSAFLVELAKAAPGIVTAATAIWGVLIARAGLKTWHVETIGKRKTELAEQALIDVYQARDVFRWVRARAIFGGEGESRQASTVEDEKTKSRRNTYFVPIERLRREKELFARLQSQRYAFAAYFGDQGAKPFDDLRSVHVKISTAASVLIDLVQEDDGRPTPDEIVLRNELGWGPRPRPDEIDKTIESAVAAIERICRPILSKIPPE